MGKVGIKFDICSAGRTRERRDFASASEAGNDKAESVGRALHEIPEDVQPPGPLEAAGESYTQNAPDFMRSRDKLRGVYSVRDEMYLRREMRSFGVVFHLLMHPAVYANHVGELCDKPPLEPLRECVVANRPADALEQPYRPRPGS